MPNPLAVWLGAVASALAAVIFLAVGVVDRSDWLTPGVGFTVAAVAQAVSARRS